MTLISEQQLDEAADLQAALTDEEWLRRSDELFDRQKALFLEVLTFARDDPASGHGKSFLDYLSSLQFIGDSLTQKGCFPPFEGNDLAAAVKEGARAIKEQSKLSSSEWANVESMRRQPFVWAQLFKILERSDVQSSSLIQSIILTLWAVTKLYADRFTEILDARDGAKLN